MDGFHHSVVGDPAGFIFRRTVEASPRADPARTPHAAHVALAERSFPWTSACLWIILLTALLMRASAITHDLPALYTHDEVSTVETALRFGGGSLRPYSYGHGPLMAYLMAGLYGVYYGGLKLLGMVSGSDDFILGYLADPTPFYIIHRGFTVALSLALIVMVYLVGRRLVSLRAGLIAAVLTAYANLLFVLSLAGREDSLYLFIVMVGVYASLTLYEGHGAWWRWAATGAIFGLATSAKYFSVFGLLFPLLAAFRKEGSVGRSILGLGAGYVGGVCIGMPFALLDFTGFVTGIAKLASQTSGARPGVSLADGLAYPTVHLYNSVGLPLYVLWILSAVILVWTCRKLAVYLLVPSLVFLAFLMSRPGNQGHYYVAFVVPFLCLAVAAAIDHFASWPVAGRWGQPLAAVLVTVLLAPNVLADFRYIQFLSLPDTREASKKWIERHVPAGASILIETHSTDFGIREGPPLRETADTLRSELEVIRRRGGSGKFWEYRIASALHEPTYPQYDLIKIGTVTPDFIAMTESEYVIMSLVPDSNVKAYGTLGERATLVAQYLSSANFRGDLLIGMDELAILPLESSVSNTTMRGPTISIWRRTAPLHISGI